MAKKSIGIEQVFEQMLQQLDDHHVEFQLPDSFMKDKSMTYTSIKRNVYLTKRPKKRIDDDGFCTCSSSRTSQTCSADCLCCPGSGSNSKDNSPMIGNVNERPVGRHKAQQMEQRSAEFNRFMEAQEKWSSDSSGRAKSVRQSRLEANLRMEAAIREQEDRKDARFREKKRLMLLTLDLSKLTPLQREMVEEDLKKYRSGGSSSSGF